MTKIRKTDLAWVGGFWDGEGSVTLTVNKSGFRLEVACSQKMQLPLLLFKKWFGGSVYGYKPLRGEICYQWKTFGAHGIEFLKIVLPYLIVKAEDAAEVINIWEAKDYVRAEERHRNRKLAAATRHAVRAGLDQVEPNDSPSNEGVS